jgi:hypothetical protein
MSSGIGAYKNSDNIKRPENIVFSGFFGGLEKIFEKVFKKSIDNLKKYGII